MCAVTARGTSGACVPHRNGAAANSGAAIAIDATELTLTLSAEAVNIATDEVDGRKVPIFDADDDDGDGDATGSEDAEDEDCMPAADDAFQSADFDLGAASHCAGG